MGLLLRATLQCLTHQIANTHARADSGGQTCATLLIVGGVAHRVCSLELGIDIHVEHAHIALGEIFRLFGSGLGTTGVLAWMGVGALLIFEGKAHTVLPLSGVTHMTPQEVVAENLLKVQLTFLNTALASPS